MLDPRRMLLLGHQLDPTSEPQRMQPPHCEVGSSGLEKLDASEAFSVETLDRTSHPHAISQSCSPEARYRSGGLSW